MDNELKSLERVLCDRLVELESKNSILEDTVKRLSIENTGCREALSACYRYLTEGKLKPVHPRFFKNYDKSKLIDIEVLKSDIKRNLKG